MAEATSPLLRQYHGIKQRYPNALLLFRLGDFYELFYEDAIAASRELQITLTSRNREAGQPVPMCGVPYHAAENYIARLIRAGYKVAICEQMEEPSRKKKLVRREVVRVITPGTATDFSVTARRAFDFALEIARGFDAEIDLLHVYQPRLATTTRRSACSSAGRWAVPGSTPSPPPTATRRAPRSPVTT